MQLHILIAFVTKEGEREFAVATKKVHTTLLGPTLDSHWGESEILKCIYGGRSFSAELIDCV